jgi:serine/threonine-protein kinase
MISEQGEVKIMDFGLARIMDEAVNRKTIAKGTPLYMAPEQVEGVGVDHRADIYSFGVTLFEMCTGTLPFTKGDIAYHHVHTDPPRPSEYNPNIPKVLEKIILRCLEKRKEDRFFSASEIKKELMPLRNALIAGKL